VGQLRTQIGSTTSQEVQRMVLHGHELLDDSLTLRQAGFISSVDLLVDFRAGSVASVDAAPAAPHDASSVPRIPLGVEPTIVQLEFTSADLDVTHVQDLRALIEDKAGRHVTAIAVQGRVLDRPRALLREMGVPANVSLEVYLGAPLVTASRNTTSAPVAAGPTPASAPQAAAAPAPAAAAAAAAAASRSAGVHRRSPLAPPHDAGADDGQSFISDNTSVADDNLLTVEMEFGEDQLGSATVQDLFDAVQAQLEGRRIMSLTYVVWVGACGFRDKHTRTSLPVCATSFCVRTVCGGRGCCTTGRTE